MVDLARYALPEVEGLDDNIEDGHGAYGVVYKVTVKGIPCMAKRLHQIFIQGVSHGERTLMESKFMNECELLSQLNHPNIVHFIGVHYSRSERDLALVMERLHSDVAAFVRLHKNVPVSIKASIMLDVSYGLLYLHHHTPPIVHRDLTAPNVLLTKDLRAKIADLGVSKVLSDPLLIKQTKAPGNVSYMAPETKTRDPIYGTGVDVFSAGHLIIHIAIQDWPKLFKVTDHLSVAPGKTEIAERQVALNEGMGRDHCMYDLAVSCLHDDPKQRPSTDNLNKTLNKICMNNPKTFKDLSEIESCEDEGESREKESITALSEQVERQRSEIQQLTRAKEELSNVLQTQQIVAKTYEDDFILERQDRQKAHSRIAEMELNHNQEIQLLRNELQESNSKVEEFRVLLGRRSKEIDQLQREKADLQGRLNIIEDYGQQQRSGTPHAGVSSVPVYSSLASSQHVLSHAVSFPPDSSSGPSELRQETSREGVELHPRSSGYPRQSGYSPTDQDHKSLEDDALSPKDLKYARVFESKQSGATAHNYVNLRDASNDFHQRFATMATSQRDYHGGTHHAPVTLITPANVDPRESLFRSRALTVSSPNLSSSTQSEDDDFRGKTLPQNFRGQATAAAKRANLSTFPGKSPDSAPRDRDQMALPEVTDCNRDFPQSSGKKFDSFAPIPRERSHAVSNVNPRCLSRLERPPSPPRRHQSLSRARSNPNRQEYQPPSIATHYEDVPKRYDHSLSVPSPDGTNRRMPDPSLGITDSGNFRVPSSSSKEDIQQRQYPQIHSANSNRREEPGRAHTPTHYPHQRPSSPLPNTPHYSSLDESTLPSVSQRVHRSSDSALPHYENITLVSTHSGDSNQFQIPRRSNPVQSSVHSKSELDKDGRGFQGEQPRIARHHSHEDTIDSLAPPSSVIVEESIGFSYSRPRDSSKHSVNLASVRNNESIDLPPLDPFLVCPTCRVNFRVGEIQEYRKHYHECKKDAANLC